MIAHNKKFKTTGLMLVLGGIFALSSTAYAIVEKPYGHDSYAETSSAEDVGLIESLTGYKYNETSFMKALGVKFGGWAEIGFTGNIDNPRGNNGPVTFNRGPNEFRLQQVYGYLEREVNKNTDTFSIGFRADLLFGSDARYTFASNFDADENFTGRILNGTSQHQLAFPQAYVDVYVPVGNGLTVSLGHFYTLIGYEVVPSAGNFFFSHAYTMQYGEPFTHTGAIATYPVNNNITVKGGVVTGWDAHFDQPANFLGSISYTTDNERTSITGSLISGSVESRFGTGTGDVKVDHNRTLYSLVLEHDVTDRLHYVLQHDHGNQEKTAFGRAAQWYGVNQYLFYDILHNLAAGMRMEWFRDDDGVRVNGFTDNYIAVTGGLNYTPIAGFTIRPEIRYDRSTSDRKIDRAFNNGKDNDQILLSVSGIFRF
ncbi:MAG: porin [Nitrosomonas sp.]|nr:porin [Nitrosomonas sp.]